MSSSIFATIPSLFFLYIYRILVALILYLFSIAWIRPATVGGTRWRGVYTSSVSWIYIDIFIIQSLLVLINYTSFIVHHSSFIIYPLLFMKLFTIYYLLNNSPYFTHFIIHFSLNIPYCKRAKKTSST